MKREFYWSLLIEPGFVQAAIWTIEEKTTRVMGMGHPQDWHSTKDLVDAVDKSLSEAIEEFDEEEEPSKTVFGVPSSWVSEGQIKKEYLDLLREVCGKLSLQPVGFVVVAEAIANFIKSEEETPLNGIVVGVGAEFLDIAVFKLGNLGGTVNVGRSENIVEDVLEGLARFKGTEALPSRMLLYDGRSTDLEKARQALIKADWTGELSGQIKFLHTPTVEVIDPEKKTIAVCLAGASEMADVSKVLFPKRGHQVSLDNSKPVPNEDNANLTQNFFSNMSPQDAGFVMDEDVEVEDVQLEREMPDEQDNNLGPADQIPDDISHTLARPEKKLPVTLPVAQISEKIKSFNFSKLKLPFLSSKKKIHSPTPPVSSVKPHISHPVKIGNSSPVKKPVLLISIILIVLLVGGAIAWWFLPKATVTLYIAPRQIQKSDTITLDENLASSDFGKKQIPARTHEVTVSGERTIETSGRKLVGEKAKGKVEIRNGTSVGIKVNAGTVLQGANNLKFSLDEQASASAALSPSTPGSAEVTVTAEDIGAEYNLAKDETLSVGNYPKSEVDARVVEDLSGGSSREIVAVSADDQKNLKSDLTSELLDDGRAQLNDELADGEILIGESIDSSIEDEKYSNKVGDEASTLRLNMTLKVTVLVINKADLTEYAKQILGDQISSGFVLRDDQIKTDFNAKNTSDDSLVFDVDFMANLLPQTDTDDIKKMISGKTKAGAQSALSSIPGFVRATIKLEPSLPGKLAVLPHVEKNIEIEISSE